MEVSAFENLLESYPISIKYYNAKHLSYYTNLSILENADRN